MTIPENTTQRDPMIHLLGALSDGTGGYIEGMEAAGQRQVVHSDRLPTKTQDGDEGYLTLGFAFGPADAGDPMFRPASLPHGWRKQGSDHSMWSYVVDEHGRKRVSIFYKAAFYDRDAFMRLQTVRGYADEVLHEGTTPLLDSTWCTAEAFTAALAEIRSDVAKRVELYRGKLDDPHLPWAAEELESSEQQISRIDALAQAVTAR
jgi:hypothetical protein